MVPLFDKAFEIAWGLSLRVKVDGLVKKGEYGSESWYDNRCSVVVTMLPTEKVYEEKMGRQGMSVALNQVDSMDCHSAKNVLALGEYLSGLLVPFICPYDEDDGKRLRDDIEDALRASVRSLRSCKALNKYHNVPVGGMG